MKLKTNVLLIVGILTISSCHLQPKIEIQMEGLWAIDTLTIAGEGNCIGNLNTNTILFNKNGNCEIPQLYYNGDYNGQMYGNWKVLDSLGRQFIIIEGGKNFFSNIYEVEFIYNKQLNLARMNLNSNAANLKMTKFLADW